MCVSPFTWEQPSTDRNSSALLGREGQRPHPIHPCLAWTPHSHTFNSFIYLSWFWWTPLASPSKNLPASGGVGSPASPTVVQGRCESNSENFCLSLDFFLMWSETCLCTDNLHVIPHTRELCKQITSQDTLQEVNDVQNFMSWGFSSSLTG